MLRFCPQTTEVGKPGFVVQKRRSKISVTKKKKGARKDKDLDWKILDGVKYHGDQRCLKTKARVCPGICTGSFWDG